MYPSFRKHTMIGRTTYIRNLELAPRFAHAPGDVVECGVWYESTMTCLVHLVPHVQDGGVVVLDDYSAWTGCRRAVHDYFSKHDLPYAIQQFDNDVTYFVEESDG